jgi:uroporphyrinogen decarboxylase
MPLLELFTEAGIDVLIGLDPEAWDMADAQRRLGGKVCLWGGVNGHLTVEQGSSDKVRAEVRRAVRILAPDGGFILSPVDNVRENTPRARENVSALIDEWQRLTGQYT